MLLLEVEMGYNPLINMNEAINGTLIVFSESSVRGAFFRFLIFFIILSIKKVLMPTVIMNNPTMKNGRDSDDNILLGFVDWCSAI